MRTWIAARLAAVALGLGVAGTATAWYPCCTPVAVEYRTVTCYRPEMRTELREVERTVYRCVPETREQEVQETVLTQHVREEQRTATVLVPQVRTENRQRTVTRCEYQEQQREQTVLVPETRMVEQQYTVVVPEMR